MDAAQDLVSELDLSPVIEAWGVQTVEEVAATLQKGTPFLVVQDGGGRARLFCAEDVLKARPGLMLDLLPGGRELVAVDAMTPADQLPAHRPLLVRDGGVVIGVLGGERLKEAKTARRTRRWALPGGGADAKAAAMDAVRRVREEFRQEGIALILDVQPSRVDGDGLLVRDVVARLLEHSMAILRANGGGTAVHLRVGDSPDGLLIQVQDRGTRSQVLDVEGLLTDEPTDDEAVLALRELADQVRARRGVMEVRETRSGTLFEVRFPRAEGLSLVS